MSIATQFHGELKGSTDAKRLPTQPFNYAYIKAATDNSGVIYVGGANVTRRSALASRAACRVVPLHLPLHLHRSAPQ